MAMIRRITFLQALIFTTIFPVWPGEGMWIPLEIDSLKLKEMQQNGFMLGPGEIYSHSHPSLKDAVVIFGGGCTGELISPDGLVLTNHHCAYSRIQSHSTVVHNYLSDGFWARTRAEELPNPGLTVTFLVRMEDVTRQVLEGVDDSQVEQERNQKILENMDRIEKAQGDSHYNIEVKPFFYGRSYYLFVYEVFKDVRLVGAPPESIGRFGGDNDNWIWPRHSGDFSLFRIYAGKDNLPAEYSPDNVPYKPRKYLSISIEGVREGDFTMVLGYPGRTDEYLTSQGLSLIAEKSFPAKIVMRQLRLDALRDEMNKSPEMRLRYAAKYVSVSNSWKKWMGVRKGIVSSDAVKARKSKEEQFHHWAAGLGEENPVYASLSDEFRRTYEQVEPVFLAHDLGNELLNSIESFTLTNTFLSKYYALVDSSREYLGPVIEKLRNTGLNFVHSGAMELDKQILPELLRIYAVNTSERYHPEVYNTIRDEFQNNYRAYTDEVFRKSYFTDSTRFKKLMNKKPRVIHELLWTDPLPALYREFSHTLSLDVSVRSDSLDKELNRLYRLYAGGLMAMDTGRTFYPDANFTMRVAFGKVEGYKAADAVIYTSTSTLQGIMEKENQDIADYRVLPRLRELYENRDFGPWSDNGRMPVCFIASNHTSGGNSGSPVLNATGELIGINFDRNWEGTVSDYVYDPNICRNISLDIRYVLFVIDKVAGASWLLDELTILHRQ
jgi:hypothetical protein